MKKTMHDITGKVSSVYGLTLMEIEEMAKAKEEGRLVIKKRACQPKMTRKELSQLYWLNREIEREEKRLWELEQSRIDTAGLPRVDTDESSFIALQIKECKAVINSKKKEAVAEYNRLMRYIEKVDDSLTRQILTLRYINGYSWSQVAMHIGGGNTSDSVRMIHKRFLEND